MVKSTLDNTITYEERRELEPEDKNHESAFYELELFQKSYEIVLGKERITHADKNVYYYPIYLVRNNKIKTQLGVYEWKSAIKNAKLREQSIADEDGEIDIYHLGEPLLYSFVTELFLKKSGCEIKRIDEVDQSDLSSAVTRLKESERVIEKDEIDKEVELDLSNQPPISEKDREKYKTNETLKNGIFTVDEKRKLPATLAEETEEDSKMYKKNYKESSRNKWIEKFVKNNNYNIVDTANNGDCLFDTIRIAYQQIGRDTTIAKMRALVASQLTDDVFEQYRTLFLSFDGEKREKEASLKKIAKTMSEYSKRIKTQIERSQAELLVKHGEELKKEYVNIKRELADTEKLLEEFEFMRDVNTIDKMRMVVQTPRYWADTWSITVLERELNMKLIIMSNESYMNGDFNGVLKCGQINDEETDRRTYSNPAYYVITSYSGNHYELISYNNKYIFTFRELPYGIKILVVKKCMEHNAGPYYLIQDFRQFKSKLGIHPDEGRPDEEEDESVFDENVPVFKFYNRSNPNPRPGRGSGEKIEGEKLSEYTDLNQIANWRKMLDDEWMAPFQLDGKRWSSVEHYYQGSKFKKTNPDFYQLFSLDSGSEISKNMDMAKSAGKKTGKHGDVQLRPKTIKIDADFYDGKRNEQEREKALYSKFTQNIDLKSMLLKTRNAILIHIESQRKHVRDELLMKIRGAIQSESIRNSAAE